MCLCADSINYIYSREPTGLRAFINSINLIQSIATTCTLKTVLAHFIKTKLNGKTADAVDDSMNRSNELIAALQFHIKPDSSKVIEGRLVASRLERQSIRELAKTADELADQSNRLRMEGIRNDNRQNGYNVPKFG